MKCLRQKALLKGAMSMSKFSWINFPWQLVWGTGLLVQRKLEQTQHRRKAEIREITGGRWHGPWEKQRELSFPQQLSGSSLTSAVNPLFPRWPQCLAAPWHQDNLPTFHSAMIFADLSQSNVSCQVPKRRRDGASCSSISHVGRDSLLLSFALCSQIRDLARPMSSVRCSLPHSNGEADNTLNMTLNPRGLLALWRSTLQRSKLLNYREGNHEKVNKQFWFTNSKIVFQGERFLQTKRQTFSVKKCFWNYTAEPYDCLTKPVVQTPFCDYKMKYLEGQTHLEEFSISRRDFPQEGIFSTNRDITRGRVIWHGLPETSFYTFAFVFSLHFFLFHLSFSYDF